MRISICLLVSVSLLGCSPGEDRNALNSQAFHEKYESVWYSPELREQYLEALQESNIPYFEQEMGYSSQLYIHTERKHSEEVSRIKKDLFGTPRGEFSVSFVDKSVQAQAASALTEAGIEVQTMSAYATPTSHGTNVMPNWLTKYYFQNLAMTDNDLEKRRNQITSSSTGSLLRSLLVSKALAYQGV